MANKESAKKRIRQDENRRARNRWHKDEVKSAVKAFEETVKTGDKEKMEQALNACFKKLDQVAAKGTIHKNLASRKKSRLAIKMQKATA